MNQITAVVYGVGAMNPIAARMMLEKGVTIVGALARSPEKVGKDLGEVAGLGFETGVLVEDDAERVLSTRKPDIATIAVSSYMEDVYLEKPDTGRFRLPMPRFFEIARLSGLGKAAKGEDCRTAQEVAMWRGRLHRRRAALRLRTSAGRSGRAADVRVLRHPLPLRARQ